MLVVAAPNTTMTPLCAMASVMAASAVASRKVIGSRLDGAQDDHGSAPAAWPVLEVDGPAGIAADLRGAPGAPRRASAASSPAPGPARAAFS